MIVNNMTILGAVPVKQFLYDELAELVLPSSILLEANMDDIEVPSDPRFQIAKQMDAFVQRFSQVCTFHPLFLCIGFYPMLDPTNTPCSLLWTRSVVPA